ncbi:MAG: hypothetical protein Q8L14_40000 [Myxococcales bacterium]|nr:hypothetical protein [Myxococcales bacterium]
MVQLAALERDDFTALVEHGIKAHLLILKHLCEQMRAFDLLQLQIGGADSSSRRPARATRC